MSIITVQFWVKTDMAVPCVFLAFIFQKLGLLIYYTFNEECILSRFYMMKNTDWCGLYMHAGYMPSTSNTTSNDQKNLPFAALKYCCVWTLLLHKRTNKLSGCLLLAIQTQCLLWVHSCWLEEVLHFPYDDIRWKKWFKVSSLKVHDDKWCEAAIDNPRWYHSQ